MANTRNLSYTRLRLFGKDNIREFAASCCCCPDVAPGRDPNDSASIHEHHVVDESAIAAGELENLLGFHGKTFVVDALDVAAHRITIGSVW